MDERAPGDALHVSVIGTGYLGTTHAAAMASLGYRVLGVDVDKERVARLSAGEVPFFEPGLPDVLAAQVESGRLRFTTDWDEAGAFGDVHFVCVGTPQKGDSPGADMSQVDAAIGALAPRLTRDCLVVGKSTVPVGTVQRLDARLAVEAPAGREHGGGVQIAWNPEFLREGHALDDTLRPDRLVFGVASPTAEATLRRVYAPILATGTPLVVCDWATAELVKAAANSFLATKISFINAMAEICERTGADVTVLAQALAYDTRIGSRFLQAGLGFGGGCLPKDIRAFQARAGELGAGEALAFLREVDAVNLRRRQRVVTLTKELVGADVRGVRVAVLGAAFKPESDDIRDSPALDVAAILHTEGADVSVYDPAAMDNCRRHFPRLAYAASALDAARQADIVLLLTEWAEFRRLEPADLAAVVQRRQIIDGRNVLDMAAWRAAGWTFRALGRG